MYKESSPDARPWPSNESQMGKLRPEVERGRPGQIPQPQFLWSLPMPPILRERSGGKQRGEEVDGN